MSINDCENQTSIIAKNEKDWEQNQNLPSTPPLHMTGAHRQTFLHPGVHFLQIGAHFLHSFMRLCWGYIISESDHSYFSLQFQSILEINPLALKPPKNALNNM